MSAFPDVTLDAPYIAQTEYSSANVVVLQIEDNTAGRSLRAFTQLGDNPSFKNWVPVQSGDDYSVNWTNADVTAAIQAFYVNAPAE